MASPYSITITNGTGTESVLNDTYNVTANVIGYDNQTLTPTTVSVVEGTDTYNFKIGATGTLTIHVTEEGTTTSNPIVGAQFQRTDSTGTVYGPVITTDASGNAIFQNVPYSPTSAPIIYYKQISSDGNHEFSTQVQNTTLTTQTATIELENKTPTPRTFTLTDTNYENLPVSTGTLTLTSN